MKHITFADKSILVGDTAADLLLEYGAVLTGAVSGDTVTLTGTDQAGNEVQAMFLLNPGISIMSETTDSTLPEPDNQTAEQYMRERIGRLRPDVQQAPADGEPLGSFTDWDNANPQA